jgi:protein SCO1/2
MMRVAKIAAIGAAAVFAALFVGWWQVDGPGADSAPGKRSLPLTAMEFSLTDQDGRDVGPETLIGEPSLVFFGFTYCPDVCPTTLSDISGWLDELGPEAEDLRTVFITVDPDRDTVETMAEYVSYFHPQIQGWTGSLDQIAAIADGFRATYEKVEGEDGSYTMNHTAGVFLFDATGRFVSIIDYHEPREFAVPKIRRAMQDRTEGAEF